MKISSVSKKVLASALSAAMVVAFAPTVAFGAQAASATLTIETHTGTGKAVSYETSFYTTVTSGTETSGLDKALAYLEGTTNGGYIPTVIGKDDKGKDIEGFILLTTAPGGTTAQLYQVSTTSAGATTLPGGGYVKTYGSAIDVDNVTVTMAADDTNGIAYSGAHNVTIDLAGHTISNYADQAAANAVKVTSAGATVGNTINLAGVTGKVTLGGAGKVVAYDALKEDGKLFSNAGADADAVVGGDIIVKDATVTGEITRALTVAKDGKATVEDVTGGLTVEKNAVASATKVAGGLELKESAKATVKAEGKVDGTTNTYAAVKAVDGTVTLGKNSVLTAEATSAKKYNTVVAIDGNITAAAAKASEGAVVTAIATASGLESKAVAISGSATLKDKMTLTATAKATGPQKALADLVDSNDAAVATGIKDGLTINAGDEATVTVDASATDADAAAIAVGDATFTAATKKFSITAGNAITVASPKAAVALTGSASDEYFGFAGNIAQSVTGTYTGIAAFTGTNGSITGGKYTSDPKAKVPATGYVISDDKTYYTVEQSEFALTRAGNMIAPMEGVKYASDANFTNGSDNEAAFLLALNNALADMAAGKAVAGISFTGENTAATVLEAARAGKLKYVVSSKKYNAKTATDEEKAAVEAIDKLAADNLSKVTAAGYTFKAYQIGTVNKAGDVFTPMAEITDLGTKKSGRDDVDNTIAIAKAAAGNKIVVFAGGKATQLAFDKDRNGKDLDVASTRVLPAVEAQIELDDEALKDAAQKGEQAAETITDPAVLAAIVQLQDQNAVLQVEGKSKTVKKGKSATIKLGVPASASGAKVTFKKANTAGKKNITVSKTGTVTVKKALKKGTYKVKVKATCGASFKNVLVKIVKK